MASMIDPAAKPEYKVGDTVIGICYDGCAPELIGKKFRVVNIDFCQQEYFTTVVNLEDGITGEYWSARFELDKDSTIGMKYDDGKLLFSCLTRGLAKPLRAVAAVLTYGAKKYKRDSWQSVPNAEERYEDALDRHLNAWKNNEGKDYESGLPHLAHAACNILFLLWFEIKNNPGVDFTKYNEPIK